VVKSLRWQVERKQRSTVDPWITFSKWGRPNLLLSLLLDCCPFPCHSSPGALQLSLLSPLPICRNFMSIFAAVICSRSGADCWVPLQFLLLFVVVILRESWERQVVRCVFCFCWIHFFFLETRNLCYSCLCILSGCVCPCLEIRGWSSRAEIITPYVSNRIPLCNFLCNMRTHSDLPCRSRFQDLVVRAVRSGATRV
jgi:hypothetical protein